MHFSHTKKHLTLKLHNKSLFRLLHSTCLWHLVLSTYIQSYHTLGQLSLASLWGRLIEYQLRLG